VEFELAGKRPNVHPDAYIAPTAVLIGDVEVEAGASVWFGAVLRADEAQIRICEGSNIQDNAVIHCAENLPTLVERNATVGHSALLEGCVVEQGALVGMGAIMLQRSRLGAGSMLAAGAVLTEGQEIPPGHLAAGIPATVKKPLAGSSRDWVQTAAQHYQARGIAYRSKLRPVDPT
jgi:carbonic anhydrase/acetyltransferase-like protein (isoleucine patch superfamily)